MPLWTTRRLIALFAATFMPRALLATFLGITGQPRWWEYDVIASNIVQGIGHRYYRVDFEYAAYAPPVWSYILSGLLVLPGESRISIQTLQAFLCLGAALAGGIIARRMTGDDTIALTAAFLITLQPSLLYYSVANSDPLPLNVLIVGLIVLAGLGIVERPSGRSAMIAGGLLALGVLSRGTPIAVLPVMALALIARHGLPTAVSRVSLIAVTVALGIAPWLARNERTVGRPLITSTAGENFWRGNHLGAGGGVTDTDGGQITSLASDNHSLPEIIRAVLRNGTEADRNEIFMKEGLSFIAEYPTQAIRLFIRKLRMFWWRIESEPGDYAPLVSSAYEVVYRLELAMAFCGMAWLFRRPAPLEGDRRWIAAFVASSALAISLLQCAFYVQGRHRFMIEPLLLMFTATGAVWLLRRFGIIARQA